ncbi:hypothetical protein KZ483_25425 [Paenibacillus sp. sptzw28]|uniref:Calx-beta domain-containing protein n=1 Tax=Paenibacillus sp. sptzw28 TaxID=715179 RepID=UPI001C6EBD72|nr:Calx-beta domain-containing protein [Paenibacillus sp. sptzw28]QYR21031.1 hypothetical protein KZ483_25425 [Paenibacillus sp. sptzw28]
MEGIRSKRQLLWIWRKFASLLVMLVLILMPFGTLARAEVAAGEISFSSSSYVAWEGRTLVLEINRTSGSGAASVLLTPIDGSAQKNEDYFAVNGPSEPIRLYFVEGQTVMQLNYNITDDTLIEGDENFSFMLSDPEGATLGSNTVANIVIKDSDTPIPGPGEFNLSSEIYSAGEGDGYANLTVNRTKGTTGEVTLYYSVLGCGNFGCSATEGEDFLGGYSLSITFANGETSKTIQVPLIDDRMFEGDEKIQIYLSSASNGATIGDKSLGVLTIVDNEPQPILTLESGTYSITENGSKLSINVLRENYLDTITTVEYVTGSGSAEASKDFVAKYGKLTFQPGQSTATIEIEVLDDTVYEGDETFSVNLWKPDRGELGSITSAQVTILENEPVPSRLEFSAPQYYGLEKSGQVTVIVNRMDYTGAPATVDYATVSGTAIAGEDFTAVSGTLTFAPGESSKEIPITFIDDKKKEPFETFSVQLSNPTGGAAIVGQGKVTVTIQDKY